jgi:hypothetical protein
MAATAFAKDLLNQIPASRTAPYTKGPYYTINPGPGTEAKSSLFSEEQKQLMIDSLKFEQIDARLINIKRAHAKTCKWLLQKSEYLDWFDPDKLELHQGLLWMKGKPGAGKSTMVKFALESTRKKKKRLDYRIFFLYRAGN